MTAGNQEGSQKVFNGHHGRVHCGPFLLCDARDALEGVESFPDIF